MAEYYRATLVKLPEYRPHHLANSILALKKLGCKVPAEWLEEALASFCRQLGDVRAHDLVTFLVGVTWTGVVGLGMGCRCTVGCA